MIETYLLEQLAAFAEYGTQSKAAEMIRISQPALSRSMRKLEDEIGVTLFERKANKVTLNESGKLAAEHAIQILDAEKKMVTQIRAFDKSRHTITLGSLAPGATMYYSSILSQLYPDMTLSTELKNEEQLLAGLDDDTYQIILLHHPVTHPEYLCIEGEKERLHLSVLPAHPAASYKEISFDDMDGETFLMFTHVGFWDTVVRNRMPSSRFLLQDEYEDFNALANASSLPAFATDLAAALASRRTNRINIPFSDPEATATYYLIIKEANRKRYQKFIDEIRLEP